MDWLFFSKNKNIKSKDSDQDGLTDYEELYVFGTDPLNKDTDHDSVPDGIEVLRNQNPLGAGQLKNLFIPGVYNNYSPEALHPRRILFYALSSIGIKCLVVVSVLLFPYTAWLSPDILLAEGRKIINLTNEVRTSVGVKPLVENSSLQQAATKKAEDMLVKEYFAHLGPDGLDLTDWLKMTGYNFTIAGENLAVGFADAQSVVNAWVKSETHYKNLIDPDFQEIGIGMAAGPYKGKETTFVAQYFGVQIETLPRVAGSTVNVEALVEDESAEVSFPSSQLIVAENFSTPIILSPQNDSVTNKQNQQIIVYAAGAEKVTLYSNDTELQTILKSNAEENYFVFNVFLQEGVQTFIASAFLKDETKVSEQHVVTYQNAAPVVNIEQSKVQVISPQGKEGTTVRAEVFLNSDATEAEVTFDNYRITLEKPASANKPWTGQVILYEKSDNFFETIAMPVLYIKNIYGQTTVHDIPWGSVEISKPSLLKQYFFAKNNPLHVIEPLFGVSSWFYLVILIFTVISLLLNIFIKIKKQNPKIIASGTGLLILLIILIII